MEAMVERVARAIEGVCGRYFDEANAYPGVAVDAARAAIAAMGQAMTDESLKAEPPAT